jgi:hypothetical protein
MPHSQAQPQQPQQPGANGLAHSSSTLDGLRSMLHHSSTSGGKHHGHHSKLSRSALQGPHSSSAFVRNASLVEMMADEVEAALREMDAAAGTGRLRWLHSCLVHVLRCCTPERARGVAGMQPLMR